MPILRHLHPHPTPPAPALLPRLLPLLVCLACLLPSTASANPVLTWNEAMLNAIRTDTTGPTLSTRNLGILNSAMHDALSSVLRAYQPYRILLSPAPGTDPEAAAASAGHEVMLALYPSLSADTQSRFTAMQLNFQGRPGVNDGLALGAETAHQLLALREDDNSNLQVPYIPSADPGQWRRTPPFFRPPLDPQWRYVRPFCLPALDPFVAPGPPSLESPEYATAFEEVRLLGAKDSPLRTPEQTQIAVFWSDFSYTAMPPGHWHEIATSIARDRQLPLPECAHLMALLSLAQADASIACWEGKYRHNFWRPITAIQRADEDNNPGTPADPAWNHYLAAPSFPEYPSGHSTFSKASAEILTAVLGTDAVSFSATSDSLPGVTRDFESLAACADEIGRSRIYGGIHFEFANRDGKASGLKVARHILARQLRPADSLPSLLVEDPTSSPPRFALLGWPGKSYLVEWTTDFKSWTNLTTVTATTGANLLVDPAPAPGARFYRARLSSP